MKTRRFAIALVLLTFTTAHGASAPGVTSLTNPKRKYQLLKQHSVRLQRGPVTAVIVDNGQSPQQLPQHRAGYNGIGWLAHTHHKSDVFVPAYAGLNFEHIHDGTLAVKHEKFEPRKNPIQLRQIDGHTVELYQAATKNWQLESCGRYQLLPDGTIEYTFECIPRSQSFRQGYIGLFWASYIQAPTDRAIHFWGHSAADQSPRWIRAVSPRHGVDSTHPPFDGKHHFEVAADFPLTLVNHPSGYRYRSPWYYGVSQGMALAFLFRSHDQIWFAQSPTGGGAKNPAWDFQWFIPDYQVDHAYGFVMRLVYTPFESQTQLSRRLEPHLEALNAR
ncbi:MAG: hypothetical protein ABGZ17_18010 [Planctomycetaceae bacterium]